MFLGWRRKRKRDDQTTTPEYVADAPTVHARPTDKAENVQGTPPPEYTARPSNNHQRARVKSRFDQNPEPWTGPDTELGPVSQSPANRSLDRSGYGDLGLGFDAAGTLPHGYVNMTPGAEAGGETSMNRSLRRSPRRVNPSTDTAPLGYVNRSFIDDTADQPTRGQPGSSESVPSYSQVEPGSNVADRSFDDSTGPGVPAQEGRSKPSDDLSLIHI